MTVSVCCSATSHSAETRSFAWSTVRSILSARYMRMSSATWSLRLRAVCSFLPAVPMRAVSVASTKVWMSSQVMSISSAPDSMSERMPRRPSTICTDSSGVMTPTFPSIVAWAMEPVMSCRYMRLSKPMELLMAESRASTSPPVRPAHSFMSIAPYIVSS